MDVNQADDLEDGEIESDLEQQPDDDKTTLSETPTESTSAATVVDKKKIADSSEINNQAVIKIDSTKKSEKKSEKKKSKEHTKKSDKERKPSYVEKNRERSLTPVDDDHARNIEKAMALKLKKAENVDNNDESGLEDSEKRKHKKRKKHEHSERDRDSKKRKHTPDDEFVDEDEMMCVRGASPVQNYRKSRRMKPMHSSDENVSSGSEMSEDRDHGRERMHNRVYRSRGGMRDFRDLRSRFDRHRYDRHSQQDSDGICLFFMQGKCYKGDDCIFSHNANPPRKLELCKFYLMDCCAKRDKCLYLHSDFPCKFYHTGMPCVYKDDCKFAHGKPLSENFKNILLKHIDSAPKEILGDFPRLSRETAILMVTNTQNRLRKEYGDNTNNEKSSQSSDEQNVPKNKTDEMSNEHSSRDKSRKSKIRHSRWCEPSPPSLLTQNILCIQNLTGVLTVKQIADLLTMGIKDINQLTNLTVQQLNQLGLTANQINEIQLNSMNIQKLGLVENQGPATSPTNTFITKLQSKDFDMRFSPVLPEINPIQHPGNDADGLGRDVDMRFQSTASNKMDEDIRVMDSSSTSDPRKQKNALDIDQYTKDAMKSGKLEKDYSNTIKSPTESDDTKDVDSKKGLDVDDRLLKYVQDASVVNVKLDEDTFTDTDIRMSIFQMKQAYERVQKNEEKVRRATTDDEDDSLQIDEKWYSSDEENPDKKSSNKIDPPKQNEDNLPKTISSPQSIEPTTVLKNLGDLSKIDISDEVTKLLTSMKQSESGSSKKEYSKSRDPRSAAKAANENKDSTIDSKKITSKPEFVSIYECRENKDAEVLEDVDLRPAKDLDFRMPNFGDTDLRQTPRVVDIDLRLGLPFKGIPNYTPATEIDGSIASHPPISYKVRFVDIPKPDYTDIKNSTLKSQAAGDPRLRKIFRLSIDDCPSDTSEKSTKSSSVRSDPRKRASDNNEKQVPTKSTPLDIQTVIQMSEWYKELSTNNKISVNQQIASITSLLKKFHQDKIPGKTFDLEEVKSNNQLCMIFNNLGVALNEKGEYYRIPLPENVVPNQQQMNFNSNPDMYMGGNMIDNMMGHNQMNVMNPMNNMNTMGNFNPRFPVGDARPAPNMHGMPPGMPSNFDNYGGMGNFNSDNYNNYDNMYNGPGNNGNDYMDDYDDNYYADHKNDYQNNFREGRNFERWNRGRSRGGRDRRGYTERSKWNDRH